MGGWNLARIASIEPVNGPEIVLLQLANGVPGSFPSRQQFGIAFLIELLLQQPLGGQRSGEAIAGADDAPIHRVESVAVHAPFCATIVQRKFRFLGARWGEMALPHELKGKNCGNFRMCELRRKARLKHFLGAKPRAS